MARNFRELLEAKWDEGKFVCVGLDPDITKIPDTVRQEEPPGYWQHRFNCDVVEVTSHIACAYKSNLAFYRGHQGKKQLAQTFDYIRHNAPDIPVILDAKYADIGNTNVGYVEEAFDYYGADAVTVHPYLGAEAMQPFLERTDKGIIVLCRTSNPGAGHIQDLNTGYRGNQMPLWRAVTHQVAKDWNANGNCAVVAGATYPLELAQIRKIVGKMPILIPGIGAQGGELEATVRAGKDKSGRGMMINSSRGIIFASAGSDYKRATAQAADKLHSEITAILKEG